MLSPSIQYLFQQLTDVFHGSTPQSEMSSQLVPAGTLDSQAALAVYSNGRVARLTEALGANFQALRCYLGDDGFVDLCRIYIASHPSQVKDLGLYGESLPQFLRDSPWQQRDPFLPDLARMAWWQHRLFHAKHNEPLDDKQWQTLQPSSRLIWNRFEFIGSNYRVVSIWEHVQDRRDLDMNWWEPECALLFRKGEDVIVHRAEAWQIALLAVLAQGASLEHCWDQALGQGCSEAPQSSQIEDFFAFIRSSGLVCGIQGETGAD